MWYTHPPNGETYKQLWILKLNFYLCIVHIDAESRRKAHHASGFWRRGGGTIINYIVLTNIYVYIVRIAGSLSS